VKVLTFFVEDDDAQAEPKGFSYRRHARPCGGHPRVCREIQRVDGRDNPGHDEHKHEML
jgi:hypothetical protein